MQSCWRPCFYPCEKKNSCTSQVCQWQRPRKITNPPSPKKLADLRFFKTDGANKEIPQKPYPGIYQAGPCNDPDKFLAEVLDGLKTACPSSVLYQTMSDAVNINEVLNKYEPQFMYMDHVDLKSNVCQSVFIDYTNSLQLTHQEIDDVCKATKGQSNNRNWILARTFLLTASNFALICKKEILHPQTTSSSINVHTGYHQQLSQACIMDENMKQRPADAMQNKIIQNMVGMFQ